MGWVTRVASAGETVDPLLHHGIFTSQVVTPSLHCKSTMKRARFEEPMARTRRDDRWALPGSEQKSCR